METLNQAKMWCESKGYTFIRLSPDSERIIFDDNKPHGEAYMFSIRDFDSIEIPNV